MYERHTPKRALAAFQTLCNSAWPAQTLVPALLDALHALIPSARNLFDWTDEEGQLLHYFIEGPVDAAVANLYFEHFHNRLESEGMPAFASLRHTPAGVRGASALNNAGFFRSALYNEIWRPQSLHTRIEGVVRSRNGRLMGSLVLYRGPGEPVFDQADERMLASLLPRIAAALERCPAAAAALASAQLHVASRELAETLLMDGQGQVLYASPGASRMLMLADEGLTPLAMSRSLPYLVQRMFGRLVVQLRERLAAGTSGVHQAWPSLTRINAYGRFDAQATPLHPAGVALGSQAELLQLTVRRLEPRAVAVQRVLRDLPISAGQASICAALVAGQAQTQIARDLGVAASTVVDHTRKLYRALDVCGAAQLRELVDRRVAGVSH